MTSLGFIIWLLIASFVPTVFEATGRSRLALAALLLIGLAGALCWWYGLGIEVPRKVGDPLFAIASFGCIAALGWQGWLASKLYRATSQGGN